MDDLISRKNLLQNIVKRLGIASEDYFTAQESVVISCIYNEPSAQPEEAIPVSWIESRIERFMMAGDAFSGLTASIIRVMLNEWEKEQERRTDE